MIHGYRWAFVSLESQPIARPWQSHEPRPRRRRRWSSWKRAPQSDVCVCLASIRYPWVAIGGVQGMLASATRLGSCLLQLHLYYDAVRVSCSSISTTTLFVSPAPLSLLRRCSCLLQLYLYYDAVRVSCSSISTTTLFVSPAALSLLRRCSCLRTPTATARAGCARLHAAEPQRAAVRCPSSPPPPVSSTLPSALGWSVCAGITTNTRWRESESSCVAAAGGIPNHGWASAHIQQGVSAHAADR
jgi:hypothetical protein